MQETLVKTRLISPKSDTRIIQRERLINLIHENSDKKLILLSASAGFGKTTLTQEYLNNFNINYCWYSVSNDINSYLLFCKYLISAFKNLKQDFGNASTALIESIRNDLTVSKDYKN